MSDSFYHITESSELNGGGGKGSKTYSFNHVGQPCFSVEIHRYSDLTYDVMKSYLTRVRDKKIRNDYITLETSMYVNQTGSRQLRYLTLYLICQLWALPFQQQMKI